MRKLLVKTLEIQTAQMGKRLKVEGFLDITVKTGDKRLSPTWDLLMRYKNGKCSDDQYTEEYTQLMRESYQINKQFWLDLVNSGEITLCCYCAAGSFCHRHLLKGFLKGVCQVHGITVIDKGEFT